jgi:hypothetical protein
MDIDPNTKYLGGVQAIDDGGPKEFEGKGVGYKAEEGLLVVVGGLLL